MTRRKKGRIRRFQAVYQREQPARARVNKSNWRAVAMVMLLLAAAAGSFWLSWLGNVEVKGVAGELEQQIAQRVQANYNFIWEVNAATAVKLQQQYMADIEQVAIKQQWWRQQVLVQVAKRQPVLRWQSRGNTYLIDSNGVVIGTDTTEAKKLPAVIDASNLPVETGQQVAPAQFVRFTQQVAASQLPVMRLHIIDTTSELYADLETGYYIRFDATGDAKQQLENVARVQAIAAENGDHIAEYIDVRIPYKAYYR